MLDEETNYIIFAAHRDVLDERHLTRHIISELLDIEICWMRHIGREDLLDNKYWTIGFVG